MNVDEVLVNDPNELANIYNVLKNNIGNTLLVTGYNVYSSNVEEENRFSDYAVVESVEYKEGTDLGRVGLAFSNSSSDKDYTSRVNVHFGAIVDLQDTTGNELYHRDDPFMHKQM